MTASILEVFLSRQGEGPLVGDAQVFVRFGGCNVVCNYCDTPQSIPMKSGSLWTLHQLIERIDEYAGPTGGTVSLTGGEPLLQVAFLKDLLPVLKRQKRRIYLETNGTLPQALNQIRKGCDWIAMDLKPESAIGRDCWESQRWFLELGGNNVFVKLVLTDTTTEQELRRALDLIVAVRRDIPLVLQPATPQGVAGTIPLERLASWWTLATRQLSDVRILPQVHRLWGIP